MRSGPKKVSTPKDESKEEKVDRLSTLPREMIAHIGYFNSHSTLLRAIGASKELQDTFSEEYFKRHFPHLCNNLLGRSAFFELHDRVAEREKEKELKTKLEQKRSAKKQRTDFTINYRKLIIWAEKKSYEHLSKRQKQLFRLAKDGDESGLALFAPPVTCEEWITKDEEGYTLAYWFSRSNRANKLLTTAFQAKARELVLGGTPTPFPPQSRTLLHWAILLHQDQTAIYKLIQSGANVNASTPSKETPLTLAIRSHQYATLTNLLHHGAIPNLDCMTVAARFGPHEVLSPCEFTESDADIPRHEAIDLLRKSGCPLENKPEEKLPSALARFEASEKLPIRVAISSGNLVSVKTLLDLGISPNTQIYRSRFQTLLHYAVELNRLDVIKLLIMNGANVDSRDADGNTPLNIASIYSLGPQIIVYLLEQGADITNFRMGCTLHFSMIEGDEGWFEGLISKKPEVNEKLLYWAARHGYNLFVKFLIKKGTSLDNTSPQPLLLASIFKNESNHPEVVKTLVEAGASLDARDAAGNTALHWAIRKNLVDTTKFLLSQGANVEAKNIDGQTPLHEAAWMGSDIFSRLVTPFIESKSELKININIQDQTGKTPLHEATRAGRVSTTEQIIRLGADVNCKDAAGETPLHFAAHKNHLPVVPVLLEAKASINLQNSLGHTPLHKAVLAGNVEMVKLLIEKGADPNIQDNDGLTTLHLANKSKAATSKIAKIKTILTPAIILLREILEDEIYWKNKSFWSSEVPKGVAEMVNQSHAYADPEEFFKKVQKIALSRIGKNVNAAFFLFGFDKRDPMTHKLYSIFRKVKNCHELLCCREFIELQNDFKNFKAKRSLRNSR